MFYVTLGLLIFVHGSNMLLAYVRYSVRRIEAEVNAEFADQPTRIMPSRISAKVDWKKEGF